MLIIYIYISVDSRDIGFWVSNLLAPPHQHWTAFCPPLAGLGLVSPTSDGATLAPFGLVRSSIGLHNPN